MERVWGSYKRWAKRWVIVIATIIVVAGGVDSVTFARSLYGNQAVRTAAVSQATSEKLCQAAMIPLHAPTNLASSLSGADSARLVSAEPGRRRVGLAVEGVRTADLDRGRGAGRTLLVSPAGSRWRATQLGTQPVRKAPEYAVLDPFCGGARDNM
jgi:hypothetical protein